MSEVPPDAIKVYTQRPGQVAYVARPDWHHVVEHNAHGLEEGVVAVYPPVVVELLNSLSSRSVAFLLLSSSCMTETASLSVSIMTPKPAPSSGGQGGLKVSSALRPAVKEGRPYEQGGRLRGRPARKR